MSEPVWTTACPDWEDRIIARRPLIPFAPLFPDEAAAARAIFRGLRIVDAAGSPTIGESCRPWVFEFADAVFGAYDHTTGRRLIREFFLLVSKKNSKSTIDAAIMLTALLRNWRMSGEFIILAPTIEVAQNAFNPARDMIQADADLAAVLHIQSHLRTITHRNTGATLKVVAADEETVGGKKAIAVVVDELWLFGKRANAENMLREATGGLASRPEGFVIFTSTQSDDPPAGVFAQKLSYFRGVRDGRIDDKRSLPVLYEFPRRLLDAGLDRDRAFFYITNPNLGASVDVEFLDREYAKAIEGGEPSLRGFLAKHLNVEIGLALGSNAWPGAAHWEKNAEPGLTLDALIARCEVATLGIDGGGLDDLLGLAVIGRERGSLDSAKTGVNALLADESTRDDDSAAADAAGMSPAAEHGGDPALPAPPRGRWLLWTHAWCHRSVLELRKEIAPRLLDFAADGDLTIVERVGDDVIAVADIAARLRDAGLLPAEKAIGVDPAGIGEIIEELGRPPHDFDATPEAGVILGMPQGWKLMGAIKTVERKLAGGTLKHSGSRLMAWCAGNAKIEKHGNAISITKQAAGTAKIDPLMATFDAAALMAMNPQSGGIGEGIIILGSA